MAEEDGTFCVYAVEYVIEIIPQKPRPVIIHPHLFGVLFATSRGRAFLQSHIDLVELCKILTDPQETLINRRSVLWAVGHIVNQAEGDAFIFVFFTSSLYI